MSVVGGLECVVCVGCSRWAWKRLNYVGAYDSESWPQSSAVEFAPIPRASYFDNRRYAVYVGLNGPAFRSVTEGHVGPSHVRNSVRLDGPNHVRSGMRLSEPSHNRDPWALYLYALSELVAYF
uniref:Mono-/di-acylglycerol lipase N-terminal domain-containing protein n=1 Tax=Ananas comosus var. bracteatus TaxID=296719 RepID=A0A6V7NX65_ANACO|nr:unnamed protein product [Ananas comosus var. bracteatus]